MILVRLYIKPLTKGIFQPSCHEKEDKMDIHYDYLIVGAGPAGLQLAYFLEQRNQSYLVLERGQTVSQFFVDFPKHRKLISINKAYTGFDDPEINLRWDWNSLITYDEQKRFKDFSKDYFADPDYLVEYLSHFAKHNKLNIALNSSVEKISKDTLFKVKTKNRTYTANKLIMATGVSKPFTPDIPGIEHTTNYTEMSVNGEDFINKRVLIIGKGNSGFETADALIPYTSLIHIASPNPIRMAWKTHYVGHVRAVNNNLLDTYQLKSQNAVINSKIKRIKKVNGKFYVEFAYTLANDEVESIPYDEVLVCTGFRFDDSLFDESCKPQMRIKKRFAALTPSFESKNIEDLYFCGTIMQERDFKKKQSGFIHGFRYNIEFLDKYFQYRYQGKNFENKLLNAQPESACKAIVKSVNRPSGLWQQTGYICDVLAWDEKSQRYRYFKNLCSQYIEEQDSYFKQFKHLFIVTLEFGQARINRYPNVFAIERIHKDDYSRADMSTGIHPIIRYFHNGKLKQDHDVIEDFDSMWQEEVHTKPLLEFLKKCAKKWPIKKRKSA